MKNMKILFFGKNMFFDISWWFEGLGVFNSNSTWNFSAITQEDVHFGLRSGLGRSIFDFWCKFCDRDYACCPWRFICLHCVVIVASVIAAICLTVASVTAPLVILTVVSVIAAICLTVASVTAPLVILVRGAYKKGGGGRSYIGDLLSQMMSFLSEIEWNKVVLSLDKS